MIAIESLKKVFSGPTGPTTVLDDVSFTVRQGEIFGVIGRSGAGKSTLIRCINRLEKPTAGQILVDGQDITGLNERDLRHARHKIGMIFQHFNLLSSRTVFGNIAFPLELAGKGKAEIENEVAPLLELVGLAGKRDHYPAELSGGQKQRVGIARALASRPAVLLCDEATSALDPETTLSILALLKDINAKLGLTIVLITHEMPVIKAICDRVAVLDHGRIVELDTVFNVFTAPKTDTTRNFVRDVVDRELPSFIREHLQMAPGPGRNPVLRIIFTGPSATSPVIAEVVRHYDVLLNIMQGNVDYIQGEPFGNIVVEAIGSADAIENAIAFVRSKNLRVEILGHVPATDQPAV
jgi:D-methionine transport system ATP-binding protein